MVISAKKNEYPLLLSADDFFPINCILSKHFILPEEKLILSCLANVPLAEQNDEERFDGPFVLLSVDRHLKYKEALSMLPDFKRPAALVKIISCRREKDGFLVQVKGVKRVKIDDFARVAPYITVRVSEMHEYGADTDMAKVYRAQLMSLLDKLLAKKFLSPKIHARIKDVNHPSQFADFLVWFSDVILEKEDFTFAEKQELFAELNVADRLRKVAAKYLALERLLKIKAELDKKAAADMSKHQRDYILREQKKAIQKELNEIEGGSADSEDAFKEYEERIAGALMPPEIERHARRELSRLRGMNEQMQEVQIVRDYLDRLCDLPWSIETEDNLDLINARGILAEDHYGLEKVNQRIVEHLAVRLLKPDHKGGVLCFDGPPGVGKTHVGRAIARAMNREFIRVSLGGVKDEAEIRGHRRTYVGALPGRIVRGLISVGVKNPVFQLDEVDKLVNDGLHGNPSAALLEVLDPEINKEFVDHYFGTEAPIDLSHILFVCTSNFWENIDPTLRDRLEKIDFPGYIESEKLEIAKRHLVPKQVEENGLGASGVHFDDDALSCIIRQYTAEAGVRNLEREIATVLRSRAISIAEGKEINLVIAKTDVKEVLGVPLRDEELAPENWGPGVVTGLAVAMDGGHTITIEAVKMPARNETGDLTITGHLGEVMRESAQVAVDVARGWLLRQGIEIDTTRWDLHIHCDDTERGKEGPSAGLAMTVTCISLLLELPVRSDLALTGEITLRGLVWPVGGIKHKVLAAHRAKCKHVAIPERNQKDLLEIPEGIRKDLNIALIQNLDEAVNLALGDWRRMLS